MQYNSVSSQLGMWDQLFEAIMRRDGEQAKALKAQGVKFSDRLKYALSRGCYVSFVNKRVSDFAEAFMRDINSMSSEEFLDIIPRLYEQTGAKLSYSYYMSEYLTVRQNGVRSPDLREVVSDPAVFRCFLEYFDHRLKKWETVSYLIENSRADLLEMCGEYKWFADPRLRKKSLDLAEARGDIEMTAFLLEVISLNCDLGAEREREERRIMREICAPPDSIIVMRKKWKWKKLPGGTVMLTQYLGNELEITVPEWIGSRAVTALGANVFLLSRRRRKDDDVIRMTAIRKITLPDTITEISDDALNGCSHLRTINIPPKLKNIPKAILKRDLSEIEVGGNIKRIGDKAFRDMKELSTVKLREGVTEIGSDIIGSTNGPVVITIPRSVTRIADNAFMHTYGLTAEVWGDSYAAKFCVEHGIRTVRRSKEREDI